MYIIVKIDYIVFYFLIILIYILLFKQYRYNDIRTMGNMCF